MKCVECVNYAKCSKNYNLTIKRKHCPMAKVEYVQTNADRIRAMSDGELANFMADRSVNESTLLRLNENHGLTAVQIEDIKHNVYCAFMQWLKQPA